MRDSRNPSGEFTVFGIAALTDCLNCLNKSLLKYIVSYVLVFDDSEDIVVDSILMSFEETVESFVITLRVNADELFVCHARKVCHADVCVS